MCLCCCCLVGFVVVVAATAIVVWVGYVRVFFVLFRVVVVAVFVFVFLVVCVVASPVRREDLLAYWFSFFALLG